MAAHFVGYQVMLPLLNYLGDQVSDDVLGAFLKEDKWSEVPGETTYKTVWSCASVR